MGDFNSEIQEEDMHEFCQSYNLKSLVHQPTCFKNPSNPSCIDLILTNKYRSFQNTTVIETGLSDFHKLTATVLRKYFKNRSPRIISYWKYKNYSYVNFRSHLEDVLSKFDIVNITNDEFMSIFQAVFNKHAPLKFKYVRANESPFMTKELRKAIMLRSKLKNQLNKDNTPSAHKAYKKQRNTCFDTKKGKK